MKRNAPKRLVPMRAVDGTDGYAWATHRWLRRQVYEGRIVSYKVGGKVLIDLNDLDRMVENGRRESQ